MTVRNEALVALWAEALVAMRAKGLEPSPTLLAEIEANIRGEMDIETIFERVLARESPSPSPGESPRSPSQARDTARPAELHALLYTSHLAPGQDPACVEDITRIARTCNARDAISGVLVFDGRRFAQWLEGPLEALDRLLGRLRRDARHVELRIQDRSPLPLGRRFAGWQLGFAVHDADDQAVVHLRGLHGSVAVQAFERLLEDVDLS